MINGVPRFCSHTSFADMVKSPAGGRPADEAAILAECEHHCLMMLETTARQADQMIAEAHRLAAEIIEKAVETAEMVKAKH